MVRGFTVPRSPLGLAAIDPPPPWHYSGDVIGVEYWADPRATAATAAPVRNVAPTRANTAQRRLLGDTDDARRRTMVGNVGLGISRTPVVIVGFSGSKQRRVAFVAIAETAAARALAAAVVIRNDVFQSVAGVVAGTNPGNRGHVGAGRAHRLRASATSAYKAIYGAVPPVVAGQWVAGIRIGRIALRPRIGAACHREQGNRCRSEQK